MRMMPAPIVSVVMMVNAGALKSENGRQKADAFQGAESWIR